MGKNGAKRERNWVGWVTVGAASTLAMRKQSNTNSSHSRGTAGAHRDDCLGGLRGSKKRGCELAAEMSENERQRDGLGSDRDVENGGY